MTLASRISERSKVRPPALVAFNAIESSVARVVNRWPDIVPTVLDRDREAIVARIAARIRDDAWSDCTLTTVTRAARVVFDPDFRTRPDLADVRGFFVAETRVSTRPAFLSAMMTIYLESYEPESEHTMALAPALTSVQDRLGRRWKRLLEAVPKIFDPVRAPEALAEVMEEMVDPYAGLKEIGLRNPHSAGLMDHAHFRFLKLIEQTLKSEVGLARLFGWLKPEGVQPRLSGATAAIEAVLRPWLDRIPSEELQRIAIEGLIELYKDPRVQRGAPWGAVQPKLMEFVMRWLTGENIEFFLDVVSRVQASHMWPARRKFWLGLHKMGRIDAAWVAFSPAGDREARKLRDEAGGREGIAFGRQVAGGGRADTSLLIMRLGNCVVVEGSHSYKAHVFSASARGAPELFQLRYDCEAIRKIPGSEAVIHLGNWQERVTRAIGYTS